MANLSHAIQRLRRDPRILKLPPYVSALCIVVGIAWLLVLPLNSYSRQTYISENALLPGQVHTYFGGSEENVYRAYKLEVEGLIEEDYGAVSSKLQEIFKSNGLKVGTQEYAYNSVGISHQGQNVYSILHAPRGDGTEAIVLIAAWRNADGHLNTRGVALVLTLARYFKRWSLWSKDIIFLITPDSHSGAQAWVDSYHDTQPSTVQPLPVKSGALQGAIAVDYPLDHRFESLHIIYDGVNGQLPNLDLFNTAVSIASGQMGIRAHLQRMWDHDDSYQKRLETMLRGMLSQGLGHASGPHSSFIPYHIDAITLQVVGEGWQDEMALGRTVESCFRSLNNLLEHFHQSFFFYLLMQTNRFVSIGTYLPSAMLVAGNFTIMAIALWVKSGWPTVKVKEGKIQSEKATGSADPEEDSPARMLERPIALPLTIVLIAHFLGLIPLYVFNHVDQQRLNYIAIWFAVFSTLTPYGLSTLLAGNFAPSRQQYYLVKSFSLLLLGLFLSTLATLNFSLAFLVGILCIPLSFVSRMPRKPVLAAILSLTLNLVSPPMVLFAGCRFWDIPIWKVLTEAAFGWHVWGMWTQVVVWCVWWPAWVVGVFLVASSIIDQHQD